MSLVLRVDLDYVPWDTPDAAEFGHGEPAVFLRLLELARKKGIRLHLFFSTRAARAFPAAVESGLGEGHDVDWLCKHPGDDVRAARALETFAALGHVPVGLATREEWPTDARLDLQWRFVSACPGGADLGPKLYPVDTKPVREAVRGGTAVRAWADAVKSRLREAERPVTAVLRPQVLARFDPRLAHLGEIVDYAASLGHEVRTLRQETGVTSPAPAKARPTSARPKPA